MPRWALFAMAELPCSDAVPGYVSRFLQTTSGLRHDVQLSTLARLYNDKVMAECKVLVCTDGARWRVVYGRYASQVYDQDQRPERVVLTYNDVRWRVKWLPATIFDARIFVSPRCTQAFLLSYRAEFETDDLDNISDDILGGAYLMSNAA